MEEEEEEEEEEAAEEEKPDAANTHPPLRRADSEELLREQFNTKVNNCFSIYKNGEIIEHKMMIFSSCISGIACLISCEISFFVTSANREGILLETYASLASLARRNRR